MSFVIEGRLERARQWLGYFGDVACFVGRSVVAEFVVPEGVADDIAIFFLQAERQLRMPDYKQSLVAKREFVGSFPVRPGVRS